MKIAIIPRSQDNECTQWALYIMVLLLANSAINQIASQHCAFRLQLHVLWQCWPHVLDVRTKRPPYLVEVVADGEVRQ